MVNIKNLILTNQNNNMLFMFFFSITLSSYHVNVGFSLKPYMIFLFAIFLRHLSSFTFHKLYVYEIYLLLFYFVYGYSGSFALYPEASLRVLLGVILILSCYCIMKNILIKQQAANIKRAIIYAGITFNLSSLFLYVFGIYKLQFSFVGKQVMYGVLVERSYPRLIGMLDDPNLYVFYNTLFFTFFLCHPPSRWTRFGLVLTMLTNILTFSRGGLLAMFVVIILYILMSGLAWRKILTITTILFLSGLGYITATLLRVNIFKILSERISDFEEDGGSGRFELWGRSLKYFIENPIFGIGAFNFSEYNVFLYGEKLYVHNTFLEILSETGIIGFSFYLLFLFTVVKQTLQQNILQQYPYLFLTFLGFSLQMLSLSLIINEVFFMYLAVLTACLKQIKKEEHHEYI